MSDKDLNAHFLAALKEISQIREAALLVVAQLKNGVNVETAYSIIDRYWVGSDAVRMKQNLQAAFPDENGRMLLNAPFNDKMGIAMDFVVTRDYLNQVFPEIIRLVEEKFALINSRDLNDEAAMQLYIKFRKEPARFVEYVQDGWFEGREGLENGAICGWQDLKDEARCVDNGQFLMLDDYRHTIGEAKKQVFEYLFSKTQAQNLSLGDTSWNTDRAETRIKLCQYFLNYLEGLQLEVQSV